MSKTSVNLQDSFLNQVRKENTEVKIVLTSGHEISGLVRGFDNFTVILQARGQHELIYKHAIAMIINRRPQRKEHEPEAPRAEETAPAKKDKASGFNPIDLSGVKIDA